MNVKVVKVCRNNTIVLDVDIFNGSLFLKLLRASRCFGYLAKVK